MRREASIVVAEIRHVADIEGRYADLDPRDYVDNAADATCLEQTSARYADDEIDTGFVEVDTVLAHLDIDFERPIKHDDAVEVSPDVASLGRTSIGTAYEVWVGGELAASAETDQVIDDVDSGRASCPRRCANGSASSQGSRAEGGVREPRRGRGSRSSAPVDPTRTVTLCVGDRLVTAWRTSPTR